MRKQTLVSSLTTRFSFIETTFGRMPMFTRRSRASTFQIITARLSKNGSMVTFASDASFPRHTSTSCYGWLRRCGGSVFWFLRTILGFVAENCNGLLATTGLFLSTDDRYLFLLQRLTIPFDSLSLLLIQFSHVWHQSFVNEVSHLFSSSHCLQFLIIGIRLHLMNIQVVQFQHAFEMIRLTYPYFIGWNFCHR